MSDYGTQYSEQHILNQAYDTSTGSLKITGGGSSSTPSGISAGRTVVTTAGTAVALAASTTCRSVAVTAETDNTGIIVVGGSGVVAAQATRQGIPLSAGDTVSLDIDNLSKIYIDSTVNGDGVTYTYTT